MIFGNIVYEGTSVLDRNVVVLNDIHIDIMDYISPADCADVAFRNMWAEFEWENKVSLPHPTYILLDILLDILRIIAFYFFGSELWSVFTSVCIFCCLTMGCVGDRLR